MNVSDLVKPLANFMRRFHTILFFLVVSSGLFVAILSLLSIISLSSSDSAGANQVVSDRFDQKTIDRINKGSTNLSKPGRRASPFTE